MWETGGPKKGVGKKTTLTFNPQETEQQQYKRKSRPGLKPKVGINIPWGRAAPGAQGFWRGLMSLPPCLLASLAASLHAPFSYLLAHFVPPVLPGTWAASQGKVHYDSTRYKIVHNGSSDPGIRGGDAFTNTHCPMPSGIWVCRKTHEQAGEGWTNRWEGHTSGWERMCKGVHGSKQRKRMGPGTPFTAVIIVGIACFCGTVLYPLIQRCQK